MVSGIDACDTIFGFKNQKLDQLKENQASRIWPQFNSEPILIGKLKTRRFNNNNNVYQGPYGGFFYYSKVSGVAYSINPSQKINFI